MRRTPFLSANRREHGCDPIYIYDHTMLALPPSVAGPQGSIQTRGDIKICHDRTATGHSRGPAKLFPAMADGNDVAIGLWDIAGGR